jgi:hypothetical protein
METYVADVEWKPLPTPMWPEGSVMADLPGLLLEASSTRVCRPGRFRETTGKMLSPTCSRAPRLTASRPPGSGAARSGGEQRTFDGQPRAPSTPPVKPGAAAGWLARWLVSLILPGATAPINPQNFTQNNVQNDRCPVRLIMICHRILRIFGASVSVA